MTLYDERDGAVRPVLQIAMPRLPRIYSSGATMHVVALCNNREFYFAAPEDFEILLDHLGEMGSAYGVRLFGYTLMSNHIHLLLQSPAADILGRPLRWFMTQTAKTFHRLRNRCGHFRNSGDTSLNSPGRFWGNRVNSGGGEDRSYCRLWVGHEHLARIDKMTGRSSQKRKPGRKPADSTK